ncbi:hypothetical protein GP486_005587 [Trichoglossum hirsutum]|uniref:Uncharacterized protein n=1 Tax=Trichoglossum hirsutum TaxID=265104 RepID=A0A9P8L928_9PEZI|nr:hypothetical protein GP486_005587 [Trichoglossum hirsutum]
MEARQRWTPEPDGRGTMSLVWSCLSTLFICLWATLHLNIPGEDESAAIYLRRKLKWTFLSAIAPELVSTMAVAQWWSAHYSAKYMRDVGYAQWTPLHCFYANMGGIRINIEGCTGESRGITISRHKCPPREIADSEEIIKLIRAGVLPAQPLVTEKAIEDKSKADNFVKTIACMQALWLIAQCIGRAIQRLPISTLELSSVAYVIYALSNYLFWWKKPLDVVVPTSVDVVCTPAHHYSLQDMGFRRMSLLGGKFMKSFLGDKNYKPLSRIPNDYPGDLRAHFATIPMVVCCVVFGGIHCIAWNFSFPSRVEKIFWHVACILSIFIPLLISLILYLFVWMNKLRRRPEGFPRTPAFVKDKAARFMESRRSGSFDTLAILTGIAFTFIYCIARLYLLLEIFISLRSLPVGTYETVRWSKFLPHIM